MATGGYHIVGLESDGSVVATGLRSYGICDTTSANGFTGIVQVAAGSEHTVGLKSDGTVVATGLNHNSISGVGGDCDVGTWTGITRLAAGWYQTVGLESDGNVVATGDNGWGQCNTTSSNGFTGITQVATGGDETVGLKSNGTVVATGANITSYGGEQYDVSYWNLLATTTGVPTITTYVAPYMYNTFTAILTGKVNPNGGCATLTCRYGTNPTLTIATTSPVSGPPNLMVGPNHVSGSTTRVVGFGFVPGSGSYYYQFIATNSMGTTYGPILHFSLDSNMTLSTLTSIGVTPNPSNNLAVGSTEQFTATGNYSDGSTADITSGAAWISNTTSVATITSPGGLATGEGTGNTSITASLFSVTSPPETLTVVAPPFRCWRQSEL